MTPPLRPYTSKALSNRNYELRITNDKWFYDYILSAACHLTPIEPADYTANGYILNFFGTQIAQINPD